MSEDYKWWVPIDRGSEGEDELGFRLDWLCDHLGDAQEVMEKLWEELVKLDPSLKPHKPSEE